jgi:vacuolar-type H+-ATPase subunit I/STV1
MTGNRMMRVSKGQKKKFTYLLDAAAPTGGAPYKTWQFEQFLNSLLTVCEAITTAPTVPYRQNPELLVALKRLDEVEAQIPRLVEFIATGFSASVDQKMRELEKEKAVLEKQIAEFRAEENAADLDLGRIDWRDTERLKENARAVIRRIDVHPVERWFKVTTFDNREVIYRDEGDEIEIVSSESPVLVASRRPKAG